MQSLDQKYSVVVRAQEISVTETQEKPSTPFQDSDKWNQVLFENANKNHLHQDNLRWKLLAGYGVFFLTSVSGVNDAKFVADPQFKTFILAALSVVGTFWLIALHIEGWYYRLYVAHVVDCEKRLAEKLDLVPIQKLDKSTMKPVHPSYFIALLWVIVCNSVYIYEWATPSTLGYPAALWAAMYLPFGLLLLFVNIPGWLDSLDG